MSALPVKADTAIPLRNERCAALLAKGRGISPFQAEKLIEQFYLSANPTPARGFDEKISRLIRTRLEIALATQNLTDALREAGLLRKNSAIENFKTWRMKHTVLENAVLSAALTTIISVKFGPYIDIPTLRLLSAKARDPKVLARIREHGFETVLPELEKEWRTAAKVELSTVGAKKILAYAYYGFIAGYVVYNFETIRSVVGSAVSGDAAEKLQSEDSDEELRLRQFDSWRMGYEDITGRALDTVNVENDRWLAREQWEIINAVPAEEFRIQ